jgi:hypothetical protein
MAEKSTHRSALARFWQGSAWRKFWIIFALSLLVILGGMYGVARWYQASVRDQPLQMGASFIPAYAEHLGLDAEKTMDAMIDDLGIQHFRLVSYWNQLEQTPGNYNFELLDWQFQKVEQAGGTITLSVGMRQPRWPECHVPDWADALNEEKRNESLNNFIAAVVSRYKDSPALQSYQLENEFLLHQFGECPQIKPEQVITEMATIKQIDPERPVIISRSNNFPLIPLREPIPDQYGISVYRRVWDTNTDRYFQYPFPAWYYAFLAGMQKIVHGKDSVLHELQAEAWPPNGQSITDTSLEEQNKSLSPERLQATFQFGHDTGLRQIYLWGAEYWYYRMVKLDDPSLWRIAEQEFSRSE